MQLTSSERNPKDHKKETEQQDEVIKELQVKGSFLHDHLENLETKIDRRDKYSRRNCLLVHEVNEYKDGSTDKSVSQTFNVEINIDVKLEQIDQTHIIGSLKKDGDNNKSRPIIVKFVREVNKRNIFTNEKRFRGKIILITDSLTKERIIRMEKARDQYGFKRVWTTDGKILLE